MLYAELNLKFTHNGPVDIRSQWDWTIENVIFHNSPQKWGFVANFWLVVFSDRVR